MTELIIWNSDDVKAITNKLGFVFEHITDAAHKIPRSNFTIGDPDIVYLLELTDGIIREGNKVAQNQATNQQQIRDAILSHQGRIYTIIWGDCSKATIRKALLDDVTGECSICFEQVPVMKCSQCRVCYNRRCQRCNIKMFLTESTVEGIFRGNFEMKIKCPGCRCLAGVDIRTFYHRAWYQFDDYSKIQQSALLFLKEHDPSFENDIKNFKRRIETIEQMALRRFKIGSIVKLVGLKRNEWNSKRAKIVGKKVMKRDPIRWPIQLVDDPKTKALIKQCNLQKL